MWSYSLDASVKGDAIVDIPGAVGGPMACLGSAPDSEVIESHSSREGWLERNRWGCLFINVVPAGR